MWRCLALVLPAAAVASAAPSCVELRTPTTLKENTDRIQSALDAAPGTARGERDRGSRGAHLNPLGLFLRTSIPSVWRMLSAFPPA